MEAICNPIVSKVYQGAGGAGGSDEGPADEDDAHDDL